MPRLPRRIVASLVRAGIFSLAAFAALAFGRPASHYTSRPFERFAGPLRAVSSANAFGRSGGVKVRITMPLDSVEFPLAVNGDPATIRYQWVRLDNYQPYGEPQPLGGATFVAPAVPGFYRLALIRQDQPREVLSEPTLGVMVPFAAKRGGMLNGYRIGTYLGERLGLVGDRPEGFLEVGPSEAALFVTKHLRLSDFVTNDAQSNVWPKYVALSPRLLDKLELVISEVERENDREGADLVVDVHSGFRTPAHNSHVPSAARDSRHQFGDAADVVLDANGDGRITARDGVLVARAVEAVEQANPDLAGGLGLYAGGRVHIDARGKKTRWRG